MKVAILSYTFPRGMGYIGNMLPKYLARFGADVHYITMDLPHYFQSGMSASSYGQFSGTDVVKPGTVESVDGYTLHGLAHRSRLGQMGYVGLADKLASIRPDVVHSLLAIGWPPLEAAFLSRRQGFRLFTANHTTASVFPLAQPGRPSLDPALARNLVTRYLPGRFISLHTTKCYAATRDCADVAIRFFGVEREKVDIIPLGVDTDLFHPVRSEADAAARRETRARLGIGEADVVCVYTGQFTEAKNPALLAQAVDKLDRKGVSIKGLFIGNGPQAEQLRGFRSAIVLGFMQNRELPEYYRAGDIGVWPTQESTSMLDAAACGLPIVVNDTLQAVERIDGNGITYRLGDVDSLVAAIERLLAPAQRTQLGDTGARRMSEHFSWADLARRRLADFEASLPAR